MRTGRPRKAGPRYPSGDLKPMRDGGTPEHERKRLALVGPPPDTRTSQRIARHMAMAATPLGALCARHLIRRREMYAGRRYAALFARAVRPSGLPSPLADLVGRGVLAPEMAPLDVATATEHHPVTGAMQPAGTWDREQYLAGRQVLEGRGEHVVHAVDDLVIYEHAPRTMKRLDAIRDGLAALVEHFEALDARVRAAQG